MCLVVDISLRATSKSMSRIEHLQPLENVLISCSIRRIKKRDYNIYSYMIVRAGHLRASTARLFSPSVFSHLDAPFSPSFRFSSIRG